MAALFLLRQGRAGALKTMLLEAQVFRGLASTVSLSAESGKSEKGQPPNPKRQSPPKNVVEPKERGRLVATPAAAELSNNLSPPRSYPSVVSQGGMVASPNPDDNRLFTDEGVPKFLSRKTLVEFPQKVPSPFRKQGSDPEALQESRRGTDDSSSSSSSSSDSESDEEGDSSEADPQLMSKGKGRFPKPEASHSFENRAPKTAMSVKEKAWSQQPHPDLASPERPRQAKRKGTTVKPLKDRKGAEPAPTAAKSQVDGEFMKQNGKEKQLQKVFRSNKIEKESQKPFEVKKILSDHAKSGLSTQPNGGPVPTQLTEETAAGRQLQAAPPEAREGGLEKRVPEPDGEVAFPLFKKDVGKQVIGIAKANNEILEDQVPIKHLKPVPVHHEDVFNEKTAVPKLEEKGEIIEDSATQTRDQDDAQEPAQAAAPAEPFDNTTYKNLQHHDYTTYTFLDLNLELSKFRVPQPSSGRESPRH
ncbi:NADH dehydrogenase [ubiquinone] flavoprotein 3, mitochondrial isoform X1 [Diceros bicornis minor]|uniref:NADH dehydrogenase [ubiquinone] flavoprotein 3, mitochondrial isoform X1 n=2 Tax=Diceros bicornis minor TaxID=77932 RepID=UPI0026EA64CE|nr:NADH dehydrogenase [ubiquinone] flavoprotein 3, mitochondrial isoform X1 [Diceros bicornis minor]